MFHTIEEALEDLKSGKIIIVCDDEDRENEGDFVALAERFHLKIITIKDLVAFRHRYESLCVTE